MERIVGNLTNFASLRPVKNAVRKSGVRVKAVLARYPPQKRVTIAAAGGWKSEKQRRWFFAALRSGSINVPYQRTSTLGRGWNVKEADSGLTAIVNNGVAYGGYVQGPTQQTAMMSAIGWKRTDEVAKQEFPHFVNTVRLAVRSALGGGGGRA